MGDTDTHAHRTMQRRLDYDTVSRDFGVATALLPPVSHAVLQYFAFSMLHKSFREGVAVERLLFGRLGAVCDDVANVHYCCRQQPRSPSLTLGPTLLGTTKQNLSRYRRRRLQRTPEESTHKRRPFYSSPSSAHYWWCCVCAAVR